MKVGFETVGNLVIETFADFPVESMGFIVVSEV